MIDIKCKPIYLEFPIFQITYIIVWLLVGFTASGILSVISIKIVYLIMFAIFKALFSFSFEMFLISGRMQALIEPFYLIITIIFDFILLIIGLELISHFLNKKKIAGGYNDISDN